jgi:molybdate transport system regulatory protein
MRISARNQWPGTVKSVKHGEVMAEVIVQLRGGEEVTAAITFQSVRKLGLAEGSAVLVLVKSTEVMLAVED